LDREVRCFSIQTLPAAGEAANCGLVADLVADGPGVGVEQLIHELVDLGLTEAVASILWGGHDQRVELVGRLITGLDR